MAAANGVHHLAIATRDMKGQIEFFTQVVGMERRRASGLAVDVVEWRERFQCAALPEPIEQDHGVEVVADGVARRQQPGLDARHLGQRRHTQATDLLGFERPCPPQLPNTGQDSIELSENRPLDSLRLPSCDRLERREHLRKALAQVVEDVIAVHADAMPSMQGGSRAANQDGAGDEMLEVSFGRQESLPVRELLGLLRHAGIVPRTTGATNA